MTSKLNNNLVMNNLQTLIESTYNLIDSSVNTSIKNHLRAIAEKNKDIKSEFINLVNTKGLIITFTTLGVVCSLIGQFMNITGKWWYLVLGAIMLLVGLSLIRSLI